MGEAGHDRLHGGFGDDTYQFSGSADLGVDSLFELAGEGADTLDFSGLDFGAGIAVNLSLGETGQQVIDHGGRQLALLPSDAANFENLVGTAYGDLLTGNQFANEIHGLAGNDKIFGGAGDDLLDGGPNHFEIGGERETLDGEGGSDTYLAVPVPPGPSLLRAAAMIVTSLQPRLRPPDSAILTFFRASPPAGIPLISLDCRPALFFR